MADATDHDLLVRIDERVGGLLERGAGHEIRIRGLERWRWLLLGGGVCVVFVIELLGFTHG